MLLILDRRFHSPVGPRPVLTKTVDHVHCSFAHFLSPPHFLPYEEFPASNCTRESSAPATCFLHSPSLQDPYATAFFPLPICLLSRCLISRVRGGLAKRRERERFYLLALAADRLNEHLYFARRGDPDGTIKKSNLSVELSR